METRSDPEESQATQLIQNVLGVSDPSARSSGTAHRNKPDDSLLNESLADSSSTGRGTHVSSRYHLHGLAQTQSQFDEEDGMNQSSQKENINEGRRPEIREYTGGRPISVDNPTKTRTKGRRQDQPNQSHPRAKEPPSKLGETSKNPMQSNPRNPKPSSRLRSSSVSSQDSFAGDPPDPEQRLLSSAKQFQVPLSELARAPAFGQRPRAEGSGNSSTSSFPPLTRSSVASRSPSRVKVLVPSSESDSYSQELQPPAGMHNQNRRDGDIMMDDEEVNSQNSNASSSGPGSSMYERRDPEPDDLQSTQPTAPSDEEEASGVSDPPWLLAAARASVTGTAGENSIPKGTMDSTETKSSTSGGRPLLSLINPKNKWRFQRYHQIVGAQSGEAGPSGVAAQGPSDNQETQPSLEDEEPLPPQRGPQRPTTTAPSPLHREQRRADISKDAMDIVPDSEPSREEPPSLVFDADTTTVGGQASRQPRGLKGTSQQKNSSPAKPTNEANDDSDDDVPLAEISTYPERRDKRVQKHKETLVGVPKPSSRRNGKIQESAEIPSSVPEQDAPVAPARAPRSAKGDSKGKKTTENRKGEKAHAAPSRRVMRRIDEEEVEESKSESEQVKRFEASESDEAADEDYQEVEAQASSKKRKRGTAPTKAPVTRRKGPATRGTKSVVGSAKAAPAKQTKRPRSTTNSTMKLATAEATRVFALWRQDGHFYSGTVHILQPDNRFLVKFDDQTEAVVGVEQMRLCEFRAGDDVLLPMRTRSSKVVGLSKAGDDVVIVDTDGDTEEVEIMNIRIASRTIKSAWKDRTLAIENVVPAVPPIKTNGSPAPSGASLASAHSNKSAHKKLLSKTGLVVSLSVGNANWEKQKESLISTIKNNGGVVLDDWTSVVRMEGKHMVNNNRWVLNRDEVQWNGKEDIDRVFLLADDSSQKPKFFMAIGLGIPCLSVNWLHDSISTGEEKEWTAYMLPQGYSDRLSARISQQVDVDWGNSVHQLTDIMDNAVPAKVFSNQSILCVGPDMVPRPKGKRLPGTDEKTQEASNAVARIIMCMGAHRVEAVTELKHASVHLSDYNYVVVKDSCASTLDIKGSVVVTWSWVKECLIASRFLHLEEDLSQEA